MGLSCVITLGPACFLPSQLPRSSSMVWKVVPLVSHSWSYSSASWVCDRVLQVVRQPKITMPHEGTGLQPKQQHWRMEARSRAQHDAVVTSHNRLEAGEQGRCGSRREDYNLQDWAIQNPAAPPQLQPFLIPVVHGTGSSKPSSCTGKEPCT